MIEWVPIKDWKFENGKACVICYRMNGGPWFAFINDERALARYNREGKTITHIAELTLPVEKTLEEKFESSVKDNHQLPLPKAVYEMLVEIAKQHYEGEK